MVMTAAQRSTLLSLVMNKSAMKSFAAAVGLCAIGACVAASRPTDGERGRIEAVLRAYETAYNAGDATALARVHASDGGYYMPSGEPVVGREALERFWSQSQGHGLVLELERFEAEGAVAWAVGRWTLGVENAPGASGRFLLALRRNATGEFEIVVDLNNEARG